MIEGLLTLLILALVLLVVRWIFVRLATELGAPSIVLTIVDIILVIVLLLAVVRWAGVRLP